MPWRVNHVTLASLTAAEENDYQNAPCHRPVLHRSGRKQASSYERCEANNNVPTRTSVCAQIMSRNSHVSCGKHVCLLLLLRTSNLGLNGQHSPSRRLSQTMQPAIQGTLALACVCPDCSNATNHECKELTPKNMETIEYNTIQYKGDSQASQMRGAPKRKTNKDFGNTGVGYLV